MLLIGEHHKCFCEENICYYCYYGAHDILLLFLY